MAVTGPASAVAILIIAASCIDNAGGSTCVRNKKKTQCLFTRDDSQSWIIPAGYSDAVPYNYVIIMNAVPQKPSQACFCPKGDTEEPHVTTSPNDLNTHMTKVGEKKCKMLQLADMEKTNKVFESSCVRNKAETECKLIVDNDDANPACFSASTTENTDNYLFVDRLSVPGTKIGCYCPPKQERRPRMTSADNKVKFEDTMHHNGLKSAEATKKDACAKDY